MKTVDLLSTLAFVALLMAAPTAEAALVDEGKVIAAPTSAPLPPDRPVLASSRGARAGEPLPAFVRGVKATGSAIGSAAETTVDVTGQAIETGWSATRSGAKSIGHGAHRLWRRSGIPQLFN